MDALTLLAAVQELRRPLLCATVRGVQPTGPYGLWIDCSTPTGQDSLVIVADEAFPRLSRGAPRPARGSVLSPLAGAARRVLPGTSLQAVAHRGLDRVVTLEFASPLPAGESGCLLVTELFGRQPNLILVDRVSGQIIEAARHLQPSEGRAIAPGQPYLPPASPARPDPRLLGTIEAISAVLAPQLSAGLAPGIVLRQSLAGLTELWVREIAARADAAGGAGGLARAVLDLIHRLEAGPWDPRLILDGSGSPVAASPIRLRHVPEAQQASCRTLGEMVDRLAAHLNRHRLVSARQRTLRQVLRRLGARLRSRRAKLADESREFERADQFRRMGDILVAHQGRVSRGATEITLPDHVGGPDASITISLDPALSAAANAERLFKLARRGRRGAVRVAARLSETDAELGRVHAWSQRVAEASSLETLEAVQAEMEESPRLLAPQDRGFLDGGLTVHRAGVKRPPGNQPSGRGRRPFPDHGRGPNPEPRRFASSDGFPILVGRDTQGNDYLTMHLARSQDVWLHVQGHAGSHVVVRVPDRSGNLPRRTLVQAAQLAAYYSQARDHGKVAVDYTLRKYVRKPRKAKPGLVTISQEKTIIVVPDKSLVQKLAAPEGET
jgi:predicted ribosome quality control (RQC) complex YloA/Tae2 family protein